MEICPVDRIVLERAIALRFSDFEDAVQVACAISAGLDVIVTRDVEGFSSSSITILSPEELKNCLI